MYLPNSLYERAPHYWLFIGMLLVVLGIYLGIEMSSTFLYLGVLLGLASCAWGARILLRRSRRSDDSDAIESAASK
jgi:tetrahydromethanopterin S-methyltransferase subunit C